MKLGRLLLKGFRRNSKRKPRRKPAPQFKASSKKSLWLRVDSNNEERKSSKASRKKNAKEIQDTGTSLVPQSSAVQTLPAKSVDAQDLKSWTQQHNEIGARALASSELIRPDDKLRQSIESFLIDQRSPHTQKAYGKDLKRFVQFLHARQFAQGVQQIDRALIIAYKDSLLVDGLEHTTIDRHLATLRSFFKWLVDDGIIFKSPAENVRFLNPKRLSRTIGFSDEEVQRILKVPNLHTRTGSQHYAILMVLFYCGLRRSELCELRTSNFGEERGFRILRLRGKGNTERLVAVIPAVWNALKHYFLITGKDVKHDQCLFTPVRNNRTGVLDKPLDSSMIFYIVTKYARQAGVANRVSPHSCRATAISNARDHNVPDRAIQEFAGWASPDMITRYDKRKSSIEKSAAHAIAYGSEEERWIPTAPKESEWFESSPQNVSGDGQGTSENTLDTAPTMIPIDPDFSKDLDP